MDKVSFRKVQRRDGITTGVIPNHITASIRARQIASAAILGRFIGDPCKHVLTSERP